MSEISAITALEASAAKLTEALTRDAEAAILAVLLSRGGDVYCLTILRPIIEHVVDGKASPPHIPIRDLVMLSIMTGETYCNLNNAKRHLITRKIVNGNGRVSQQFYDDVLDRIKLMEQEYQVSSDRYPPIRISAYDPTDMSAKYQKRRRKQKEQK